MFTVVLYTIHWLLQVLSLSLSKGEGGASGGQVALNPAAVVRSQKFDFVCLLVCSAPLVGVVFLLLIHALILSVEQLVRKASYAKYMLLVSNVKFARVIIGN